MSWTYAKSPSTTSTAGRRDAVRLLINDLTSSRPLRQDEEIAFALAQEGNSVLRGAAFICETLADSEAITKRVGDLSLGAEKPVNYRMLADRYRRLSAINYAVPYGAAFSISEKYTYQVDTDRVEPSFTAGMMQHPGTLVGTTST